ncbi:MAG: carboxypeptidase-like regulatory domain-containing protein, partial [Bdellovibrionota bacterium]
MIIRKFLLFFTAALLAGAAISSAQGGPSLNIPLKKARVPEGVLEGTLTGPTGVVSGAAILAEPKSGGAAIPVIIDPATGRFEMKLPPGVYKLTVSAPGHATSVTEIEVKDKYR